MIKLCAFSDEAASSLEGQIAALRRNGIPYMEIRNVDGKNIKDISLDEARSIKRILDENNIKVWSVGSPLGKVDIDTDLDEYMQVVCHILEIAKILECDRIRMFSFFKAYDKSEKVMEYLKKMVKKAATYNIKLCHENEKDIFGDTAERNLQILENVPGLCYVYDPANFLQVGEEAKKTLSLLADKAEYFHIKDVISETGELVPAGEGDGRISDIIASVIGNKVLTLEPHLTVFTGYTAIDSTEMKNKYAFDSNDAAFDAAVVALKGLLADAGYIEKEGGFTK